jgi:hypothetical protein
VSVTICRPQQRRGIRLCNGICIVTTPSLRALQPNSQGMDSQLQSATPGYKLRSRRRFSVKVSYKLQQQAKGRLQGGVGCSCHVGGGGLTKNKHLLQQTSELQPATCPPRRVGHVAGGVDTPFLIHISSLVMPCVLQQRQSWQPVQG